MASKLDSSQILPSSYSEADAALRVRGISGVLVTEPYDHLDIAYVAAGNGLGEVASVTYKTGGAAGTVVATLTLGYDASNKLISVTKS